MRLTSFLLNLTKASQVTRITHVPVLAREIISAFNPQDGQMFLDMTFGGGGHTKHLLATNKSITVLTLDRDPQAFERSLVLAKELEENGDNHQRVVPMLGRFSELSVLLARVGVGRHQLDGVIMDLGASSFQFEQGERGFSLRHHGPLDMRMDGDRFVNMPTAADVINSLDAEDMAKIFKIYGEERYAKKIAQAIVDSRFMMKSIRTTQELASFVENLVKASNVQHDKLGRVSHPATKIFQALRIFVNNELNELDFGLELVHTYLRKSQHTATEYEQLTDQREGGGLLAVISFHSLEDRIVKTHLAAGTHEHEHHTNVKDYKLQIQNDPGIKKKRWLFYTNRFIVPSPEEVAINPRSRSAKLRLGLCMSI